MHLAISFLALSAILVSLLTQNCKAEIHFSNSNLQIYASKNISAFQFNEAYIEKFLKHLSENEIGHSLENFENAFKFAYPNISQNQLNSMKKARLSNLKLIKVCKRDILENKNKASEIFRTVTRQSKHKINKRGISFLGEALSAITNNPSPTQWSEEKKIVEKIARIAKGEQIEINQLKKAIHEQNLVNTNLIPTINELGKNIAKAESEFSVLDVIFENYLKIDLACKDGKKLSENLLKEALEIESIFENSLKNQPDKSLFPPGNVLNFINQQNKNIKVPVFQNSFEVSKLYQMSSAVTVIESDVIHSMLSLPLVDFTLQYEFIDYPILNENEIETINKLSKIALRPIDIFLCCDTLRRLRLFSSSDLERCAGTTDGKSHICKGRTFLFPMNGNDPCTNFHIPNTIAIELSSTLILIKSDQKQFTLQCGTKKHAIFLNSSFTTLHIPKHCELHGKNTFIGRYEETLDEKIEEKFNVMTAEYPILSNYTNGISNITHLELKNHVEKIDSTLKNVTFISKINKSSFDEIREEISLNKTYGISVTIIVILLKVTIVTWIVWKCYKKFFDKKISIPLSVISQV